jgi:hypothetical protein
MSTKIQFPNNRLTYTGKAGPIFDTDIENLTQNLLQMVNILLGLPSNGFAILQGFTYASGAYSSGFVYMNGVIYYCTGLVENKYLAPNPTGAFSKLHNDLVSRNTYTIYNAVQNDTAVGGMPQFVGNMDQYRISINNKANRVVDLGDKSDADFKTSTFPDPFTLDGSVHTLDLSGLSIPVSAKMVLLSSIITITSPYTGGSFIHFRKYQNTNENNALQCFANEPSGSTEFYSWAYQGWVPIDSNLKIDYRGKNCTVNLTVCAYL